MLYKFMNTWFHHSLLFGTHRFFKRADIIKASDVALYRAKHLGKGTVHYFTSSLNQEYQQHVSLLAALQAGIEKNAFYFNYQPRFELSTGKLLGFEALARWNDATIGQVPPDQFIRLAEKEGLIIKLGTQLLQQFFEPVQYWNNHYPKAQLKYAVNISPSQLSNPEFVRSLISVIRSYQIPFNCIEFELTESLFSEDGKQLEETLNEIHELGIQFAIDDFGTGYSCLSRLNMLPIDILKIDRSFVDKLSFEHDGSAIIRSILALSESLKLDVIAEGIETKEQADLLIQLSCKQGQGYYFSKPLDPADAEKLIKNIA